MFCLFKIIKILGGSPAIFGWILNLGHTFLYFLIGARTLSEKFRIKSENWYKKFRVVESIGELVLVILFFAQVVSKDKIFLKKIEINNLY